MNTITVCVGSSCYIKGAHHVAKTLEESIARHNLLGKVQLRGSFCLGRCREGVAVTLNGNPLPRVTPENAPQFFLEYILPEASSRASN